MGFSEVVDVGEVEAAEATSDVASSIPVTRTVSLLFFFISLALLRPYTRTDGGTMKRVSSTQCEPNNS